MMKKELNLIVRAFYRLSEKVLLFQMLVSSFWDRFEPELLNFDFCFEFLLETNQFPGNLLSISLSRCF